MRALFHRSAALAAPAIATSALAALAIARPAAADTLHVGPGQTYAMPCDAIGAAHAGDIVQVDASGHYDGDTCAWSTEGLVVQGVNGRAKIDLTGVTPAQEKGIFTIGGTASATIENFELSGAAVSSSAGNNGAGIRHQGLNLTVRNCYIHDNQDGILGAPATAGTGAVVVESSEFSHNGAGDGFSHNLYIGNYASFTLQFSYSHRGNVGHLVKSRALETFILYDRITDESGGTASYEIDIPNAGTAYVIGSLIEQSATTQNPAILSFGEEGTPAGYDTHLFVVNDSFVNDSSSGTFVADTTTTPATITNDVLTGPGVSSSQTNAAMVHNFVSTTIAAADFVDVASFDLHLRGTSPCIDDGAAPGTNGAQSLMPAFEYVHPLGSAPRAVFGAAIDVGAYEYTGGGATPAIDAGGVDDGGAAGGGAGDGGTAGDAATAAGDAATGGIAPSNHDHAGCACAITGPARVRGRCAALLAAIGVAALARRRGLRARREG
jgi:hypothetical protein